MSNNKNAKTGTSRMFVACIAKVMTYQTHAVTVTVIFHRPVNLRCLVHSLRVTRPRCNKHAKEKGHYVS